MTPVDLVGVHVEAVSGTRVVVLRERDEPHRVLAIAIGEPEAVAIALGMSGKSPPRPLSHDLLAALVDTLHAEVEHVEVTGVEHGTYLASLAVRAPSGRIALDSRPSDAIALALRVDAPLYASETVLDEAGAYMTVEVVDDRDRVEDVEEDVDEFRAFLDEVDPSEFEAPPDPDAPDDPAG
jgi:bifunctional DNase/RNase